MKLPLVPPWIRRSLNPRQRPHKGSTRSEPHQHARRVPTRPPTRTVISRRFAAVCHLVPSLVRRDTPLSPLRRSPSQSPPPTFTSHRTSQQSSHPAPCSLSTAEGCPRSRPRSPPTDLVRSASWRRQGRLPPRLRQALSRSTSTPRHSTARLRSQSRLCPRALL